MNSDHDTSEKGMSVRDRILSKIERNEVRMHSYTYFAIGIACISALTILVLLLSVFIGNFVFFILRINGHGHLLSLGTRGWLIFFQAFPWWLLAFDVLLCAGTVVLMRRFQFGYRKSILSLFATLVVGALILGYALDAATPVNDSLLREADRGTLPHPFDTVYKDARRTPPQGHAYRGTIISIDNDILLLDDPDLEAPLQVHVSSSSRSISREFIIGQPVFVIGESNESGIIEVYEIHSINPNGLPPRRDQARPGGF